MSRRNRIFISNIIERFVRIKIIFNNLEFEFRGIFFLFFNEITLLFNNIISLFFLQSFQGVITSSNRLVYKRNTWSEISLRCRTEEWLRALDRALNKGYVEGVRGKGVILVSDNGSQPTSRKFLKERKVLGIKQVFTSYNNPKGNANTERCFRTYKEEVA